MKNYKTFIIFTIIVLTINSLFANVRVSPPLLFLNEPSRSTSFKVMNLTDNEIEIWLEIKYGFVTTDDSNNIYIKLTDKIESDDQPAHTWSKSYPAKFVLKSRDIQFVRIIVNPPSGLQDGEYWARLEINSKPLVKRPLIQGDNTGQPKIGLEIINQQSIPFHYRKGKISTGVDIISNPEIYVNEYVINFLANFRRFGNSSYWGRMNFQLKDSKGKLVKQHRQNLVIYKDITLNYKIDITGVATGDYILEATAETIRDDDAAKFVVKIEPRTWKYNIRIK